MAHLTVRGIYIEAMNSPDGEERKLLSRHAVVSEAYPRIESMLKCARPYLTVRVDELDQHPQLLNVANGMLDLSSGVLQTHDPQSLNH